MKTGRSPARGPHAAEQRLAGVLAWMRRRQGALAIVAAFAVVAWAKPMGLLLWARIRILTSLPKTAIADDPAQAPDEPPAPIELDPRLPARGDVVFDPFQIDPHTFPRPTPAPATTPEPVAAPKVVPEQADVSGSEAIDGPRIAAERFRLQAAGRGLSTAVIDGRTVRIGDALVGTDGLRFTVVGVLEGAVLLEHDGRRFEIRLHRTP